MLTDTEPLLVEPFFVGLLPDSPITHQAHVHAQTIFTILNALERGPRPQGWIEQLVSTELGFYGEEDDLGRSLGAKACVVQWAPKSLRFVLKPASLKRPVPEREARRFRVLHPESSGMECASNWNPSVCECLMSAAKIAFIHGYDIAARACLEEMAAQCQHPTVLVPSALFDHEKGILNVWPKTLLGD